MTTDHIGDALRKRGLEDFVLRVSFVVAASKPEVIMALKDALEKWIADEKLKGATHGSGRKTVDHLRK